MADLYQVSLEMNLTGFIIIWYFEHVNCSTFQSYGKWINPFPSYEQITEVVKLCNLLESYGKHVVYLHVVSSFLTAYFSRGFSFLHVVGSLVLVGGDPGVGKSTLVLQVYEFLWFRLIILLWNKG